MLAPMSFCLGGAGCYPAADLQSASPVASEQIPARATHRAENTKIFANEPQNYQKTKECSRVPFSEPKREASGLEMSVLPHFVRIQNFGRLRLAPDARSTPRKRANPSRSRAAHNYFSFALNTRAHSSQNRPVPCAISESQCDLPLKNAPGVSDRRSIHSLALCLFQNEPGNSPRHTTSHRAHHGHTKSRTLQRGDSRHRPSIDVAEKIKFRNKANLRSENYGRAFAGITSWRRPGY
jgi:hypothetical protein